jgi:hypothetical protein
LVFATHCEGAQVFALLALSTEMSLFLKEKQDQILADEKEDEKACLLAYGKAVRIGLDEVLVLPCCQKFPERGIAHFRFWLQLLMKEINQSGVTGS